MEKLFLVFFFKALPYFSSLSPKITMAFRFEDRKKQYKREAFAVFSNQREERLGEREDDEDLSFECFSLLLLHLPSSHSLSMRLSLSFSLRRLPPQNVEAHKFWRLFPDLKSPLLQFKPSFSSEFRSTKPSVSFLPSSPLNPSIEFRRERNGCLQSRRWLRLLVQGRANRRLRCRQVQSLV